jgi:DNA-binding transcriptional regulator YbjK
MPHTPPSGRSSRPATPRRRQLLDAAVAVLAAEGLRGLTHRAVDRAAGLPEGSCSAYLRTRSALQQALAEHVSGHLLADVDALAERLRTDPDCDGVTATRDLLLHWLEDPDLLLARLELTMAARRDPELARLLAEQRARLVDVVAGVTPGAVAAAGAEGAEGAEGADGSPDPGRAEALVAAYDGLLIAALAKPAAARSPFLRQALDLLRGGLAARPAG